MSGINHTEVRLTWFDVFRLQKVVETEEELLAMPDEKFDSHVEDFLACNILPDSFGLDNHTRDDLTVADINNAYEQLTKRASMENIKEEEVQIGNITTVDEDTGFRYNIADLKKKYDETPSRTGIQFKFLFPNGGFVLHSFGKESLLEDLYHFVGIQDQVKDSDGVYTKQFRLFCNPLNYVIPYTKETFEDVKLKSCAINVLFVED